MNELATDWKSIPDAPGYELNSQGQCRSAMKILKPYRTSQTSSSYGIPRGGKKRSWSVGALVREFFGAEAAQHLPTYNALREASGGRAYVAPAEPQLEQAVCAWCKRLFDRPAGSSRETCYAYCASALRNHRNAQALQARAEAMRRALQGELDFAAMRTTCFDMSSLPMTSPQCDPLTNRMEPCVWVSVPEPATEEVAA